MIRPDFKLLATYESQSSLYHALGFYVHQWANLERLIDTIVVILFLYRSSNNPEKTMPKSLKRKIRYIRQSANEVTELEKYKIRLLKLSEKLSEAKEIRHDIIHGSESDREQTASSKGLLRWLENSNFVYPKDYEVTTLGILKETQQTLRLQIYCQNLGRKITENLISLRPSDQQTLMQVRRFLPILPKGKKPYPTEPFEDQDTSD